MKSTAAERVEKMMTDLSVDQPQFGQISGASKSVVNQWLCGKIKTISAEYAYRIQKSKGYSAQWIQTGEGEPKVSQTTECTPSAAPATLTTDQLLDMLAQRLAQEPPAQAQDAIAVLQGEVSKARRSSAGNVRADDPPQYSPKRQHSN
jgi:transcriptional regulator with XRE-family HTH domain